MCTAWRAVDRQALLSLELDSAVYCMNCWRYYYCPLFTNVPHFIITFINNIHKYINILNTYTQDHRISIPAYAIEQQWWHSDVPKNKMSLMSLICINGARSFLRRVTMWLYFKNYWHASKWSSISFSRWQCPSDGDFSFPRFVCLLILSLWLE
jgi:hypothetical protein